MIPPHSRGPARITGPPKRAADGEGSPGDTWEWRNIRSTIAGRSSRSAQDAAFVARGSSATILSRRCQVGALAVMYVA
jgi:hypothetical protein